MVIGFDILVLFLEIKFHSISFLLNSSVSVVCRSDLIPLREYVASIFTTILYNICSPVWVGQILTRIFLS